MNNGKHLVKLSHSDVKQKRIHKKIKEKKRGGEGENLLKSLKDFIYIRYKRFKNQAGASVTMKGIGPSSPTPRQDEPQQFSVSYSEIHIDESEKFRSHRVFQRPHRAHTNAYVLYVADTRKKKKLPLMSL